MKTILVLLAFITFAVPACKAEQAGTELLAITAAYTKRMHRIRFKARRLQKVTLPEKAISYSFNPA